MNWLIKFWGTICLNFWVMKIFFQYRILNQNGNLLISAKQPALDVLQCNPSISLGNFTWNFSITEITFRERSTLIKKYWKYNRIKKFFLKSLPGTWVINTNYFFFGHKYLKEFKIVKRKGWSNYQIYFVIFYTKEVNQIGDCSWLLVSTNVF